MSESARILEIAEESAAALKDYCRIPIAFTVDRIYEFHPPSDASGAFRFSERILEASYPKDYDLTVGEGPGSWPSRFDVSTWAFFAARQGGIRVGGAAVAFNTPGADMLEGRMDLAMLWDLRILPEARGRGIGGALFRAAEAWAAAKGCRVLKVETQNTNVPACRFYAKQGCRLERINRSVYEWHPDEIQMLWYKDLPEFGNR